jgi:hypothetical protein
LSEVLTSGIKN